MQQDYIGRVYESRRRQPAGATIARALARFLSRRLSFPCFSSGSNLVVPNHKSIGGLLCSSANQEVKCAPLKIPFSLKWTNATRSMRADGGRLLSCQIKWHGGWLLETDNKQNPADDVCRSRRARKARYTFDTWSELTSAPAISQTNTTPCAGSVFIRLGSRKGYALCFLAHTFLGLRGAEWKLSLQILCHYVLHLPWQTLWLHIIWVISLHFYAADVSPCQRVPPPPLTKQDGEPSFFFFKVLHMSLPSLLSFPLPKRAVGVLRDVDPDGGKTYSNRCPCVCIGGEKMQEWHGGGRTKGS